MSCARSTYSGRVDDLDNGGEFALEWSASDVDHSADLDQLPASGLDICVGGHFEGMTRRIYSSGLAIVSWLLTSRNVEVVDASWRCTRLIAKRIGSIMCAKPKQFWPERPGNNPQVLPNGLARLTNSRLWIFLQARIFLVAVVNMLWSVHHEHSQMVSATTCSRCKSLSSSRSPFPDEHNLRLIQVTGGSRLGLIQGLKNDSSFLHILISTSKPTSHDNTLKHC